MGTIGVPEMLFILLLALLFFGPRKLPELGKALGRGLAEFRRASNELRDTIEQEVRSLEQEIKPESTPSPSALPPAEPKQPDVKSSDTIH